MIHRNRYFYFYLKRLMSLLKNMDSMNNWAKARFRFTSSIPALKDGVINFIFYEITRLELTPTFKSGFMD